MSERVLLVDARQLKARQSAATGLQPLLLPAGLSQAGEVIELEQVVIAADRYQPDAIIVDIDGPEEALWPSLARLQRQCPRPTLLLCEQVDPSMVQRAFEQGMSVYSVHEPSAELLRSLFLAALGHFRHYQRAVTAAAQARRALEEQRVVDRARCLLMERYRLSEREAYARLRRLAMDRRQRLADAALALLSQAVA